MSGSRNNNRKRKLESIAKLLIDTKNDHEFENALKRVRELAHKESLSLKEIMLENLRIDVISNYEKDEEISKIKYEYQYLKDRFEALGGHKFEIALKENERLKKSIDSLHVTLIKQSDKIDDLDNKIEDLEIELKNAKKKDKLDFWKKNASAFENKAEYIEKKASKLESELTLIMERDELKNYNAEQSIKNFIDDYKLKNSNHQKNWISTQSIYLSAKPFLNTKNKEISIKKFSLMFGKILGVNSTFGGNRKKHKGFLIESDSKLFLINMSSK